MLRPHYFLIIPLLLLTLTMHLKLFRSVGPIWGDTTPHSNSLFNDVTLVVLTQLWWVRVFTPENLVKSTNQGFIYCSPPKTSC